MRKQLYNLGLLIVMSSLLIYCVKDSAGVGPDSIDYGNIQTIEYSKHVQPLLNEYTLALQAAGFYPPGLQMDSWSNLIKGWDRGEAVIPFDSDNSILVELSTKLTHGGVLDSVKTAFLKRWIDQGARNDAGDTPFTNAHNLLYVCSQGEAIVSIIDADNLVIIRNVDLTDYGFDINAKPHHITFSPDQQFWYVSCIDNGVNKVLKFTVADNQLAGEFDTPLPALLDHHPTENELYVSRFMDPANPTNAIAAVNTATMTGVGNADGSIQLPPSLFIPHAMKLSHSGDYVYTASFAQDMFLVINHGLGEFEDAVTLGNDRTPLQVAVTPDDSRVNISCIGTGEIVIVDVSDPTPGNRSIAGAALVGGQPWHGIFSPDGSTFYVGNLSLNQFHAINTATLSVQTHGAGDGTDGLAQLHGSEMHPEGTHLFLSGRNTSGDYHPYFDFGDNSKVGTVVVVNTADNAIEKVLEIENFGSGMRLLSR